MSHLLIVLLLFRLQLTLALPLSTLHSNKDATPVLEVYAVDVPLHGSPSSHAKHLAASHRVPEATIVEAETLRVVFPSTTATLTELMEATTIFPKSIIQLSELHPKTSSASSAMTSATSSSLPSIPFSSTASTPAVSDLGNSPATPLSVTSTPPEKHSGLSSGRVIGVAIAASLGANILLMTFVLLLRRACARRPQMNIEHEDNPEKARKDAVMQENVVDSQGVLRGVRSPMQRGIQRLSQLPNPATRQPLPFSFSSFWSSASSLALEHARSQEPDAPRRFTTFGLSAPINTHPDPTEPDQHPKEDRSSLKVNSSPDVPTIMSPLHSGGKTPTDPRSPRCLSIPLFMEHYASPSIAQYLPPESRSTMATRSARGSYLSAGSVLQGMDSSQDEVEGELGSGTMHGSPSLHSLPSVSSEVMTPRRHWTFVDIHGPSTPIVSPPGPDSILNRLSSTGSSHTVAIHTLSNISAGQFQLDPSDSGALLSEPRSTGSFLHSNFETSASSGFTQYRSADDESVVADILDHSRRTF